MSYEKLIAAGAEPVGGKVYINRVELAFFGDNGFTLTEEGERWIEKYDSPKAAKPAKAKAEPKVVEPEPASKPEQVNDLLADLDKL